MERLTAQEEEIMLYIWKFGSCFIRDILNDMPEPRPPYTSVASVIRNLGNAPIWLQQNYIITLVSYH